MHDLLGGGLAQRQCERALAAIQRLEPLRLAGHELGELPPGFALGRLDLDHVRAHVGEVLAAERSGDDLGKLEHADAGQRAAVRA